MKMKNNKKRILILTDQQIDNCILSGVEVESWILDKPDSIGCIHSYNNLTIKIGDDYFMRENCTFFLRKNYFKLV
jgi:hypothetical protein